MASSSSEKALEGKYTYVEHIADTLYGEACRVRCEKTNQMLFAKISYWAYYKAKHAKVAFDEPLAEAKTMEALKGTASIVPLLDALSNETAFTIITPYYAGGDLFEVVAGRSLSNKEIVVLFGQILSAVLALKERDVVNIDLSLENIIVETAGSPEHPEKWRVRLIDLGSTCKTKYTEDEFKKRFVIGCGPGKPIYMPPEASSYNYTTGSTLMWDPLAQQVWSLGSLLYILTMGAFFVETRKDGSRYFGEGYRVVLSGRWRTTGAHYSHKLGRDTDLLDFIDRTIKPLDKRITFDALLNDPWVKNLGLTVKPSGAAAMDTVDKLPLP
ncbi:Protein kinase [uncultured virus]|nr:Protein kinase [uncultured virus]